MSSITLFMLPEPGHLLPTFRFALALQRRGHVVTYLSIPEFRDTIQSLGFRFHQVLANRFHDGFDTGTMFDTLDTGAAIYSKITSGFRSPWPTDAVVSDLAATSPDLIIIDSATVGFGFWSSTPGALRRLDCPILRVSATFTEEHRGFPGSDFESSLPELILCPREFDLPSSPVAPYQRHFVESSVLTSRPEPQFSWHWIDQSCRLVYCSLGTQSRQYPGAAGTLRKVIEAFRGFDKHQLVINLGGHQSAEEFGAVPSNVLLQRRVPQASILQYAATVITHGGLGTIKESILAAIPLIVMPFAHDQPQNANRVAYHRLGLRLDPHPCSAEGLRAAVLNAGGAEIRTQAVNFQRIFRNAEDRSPSVSHIERFVAQKSTVPAGQS